MKGLYRKYAVYPQGCEIEKANGSEVDEDAAYIVLRVDAGEYVDECRAGVLAFARSVAQKNSVLSDDLVKLLSRYGMEGL